MAGYNGAQGAYDFHYWWELPPDAFESDNSASDFTVLTPTYAVQNQAHNLHNTTDQDWYYFEGVPGRLYRFYSNGTTDTQIYLYQENGIAFIDYDDDDGNANNFYLEFSPTVLAIYKLRVDGHAGSVGAYDFYFNHSAPEDLYEEDNSASQFTEISFTSSYQIQNHTLHTDTDQDWFRFFAIAGAGKIYQISSLGYTNTQVYLYQDNGTTLVGSNDDGSDTNFYLQFAPSSSGYYKLKITGNTGNLGAYQFRFIMEGLIDSYEDDDSATQHTILTPTLDDQSQNHAFNNNTDQDWYIFQGIAGKTYTFYSAGVVDTWAELYQSNGSTLIAYDDDGTGSINFSLVYTPTVTDYYLIRVTAYGGEVGNYQFHYYYSAPADAFEPDESAADPTPLVVTASVQTQAHTLHSTTDRDWYRFQGLAGRTYHFLSTSGTDTQIYLYTDNWTTLLASDDDGAGGYNFHLAYTPTTTAYYTLKVIGWNGDVGAYGFNYYYSIGLTVPQNVTITNSGSNTTLNWDPVAGAVSYIIEISWFPDINFVPLFTTTSTSWSGSTTENRVFFRIRASDQPVP